MKFRPYNIIRLALVLFFCASGLQSCYDELEYVDPDAIPEGSTDVACEIDFMPMAERTMGTRAGEEKKDLTLAAPGNGMSDFRDLCVLIYNDKKQLQEIREIVVTDDMKKKVERHEGDAMSGGKPATPAEDFTWRVKFDIENLSFGRYYIYAVANIGKYNADGTITQSSYQRLSAKKDDGTSIVQTPEELASLRLEWDASNYHNNGGMLGHFSTERSEHAPNDWVPTPVIINRDKMLIHSWLRRAASKVTIDFDPSGLRDNIKVWIRKAEICDIPKSCPLGMMNVPGAANEPVEDVLYRGTKSNNASPHHLYYADAIFNPNSLDEDGEKKEYNSNSSDHNLWPMLRKGSGRWPLNAHDETQMALFFYENRQGEGRDKRQYPDQNGGVADSHIKKDEKPYGTYIEVEAYYQNLNPGSMSQGKIIYRFMLGQDEVKDYNAFRNHHYKITMRFRGNANDVDWHIEYADPEPIVVPVPYYISYLYNHNMKLPLRMAPEDPDRKITKLHAFISRNDWWPYGGNPDYYYNNSEVTGNTWTTRARGFLSLKPADLTRVGSLSEGFNTTYNQQFYYGNIDGINRSERDYAVDKDTRYEFNPSDREGVTLVDTVNVTPDKEGNGVEWMIPMYTRAKQLVKTTGYTGNNPYVGHYRLAQVEFTATLDGVDKYTGKDKIVKIVDIRQVERIENPKGIYRKWNSREPFQVTLKKLAEEGESQFTNYISDGPWRAFIVRGDRSFIDIGKPGMKNVSGNSGTPIDFSVRFKGASSPKDVRSCVIRVEYNNYSCVHLIYVRQGYEPQELFSGDVKWHISNMNGKNAPADHPCDEGSMFKWSNWEQPIDVGNTILPVGSWAQMYPDMFRERSDNLLIYGGKATPWTGIAFNSDPNSSFDLSGGRVATCQEFTNLINSEFIEQGYGVLYADGATKTAETTDVAYGYNRAKGHTTGYGMRGVFCYNRGTDIYGGRSVFFPIGNTGYGQRKDQSMDPKFNYLGKDYGPFQAVLRYAGGRTTYMPDNLAKGMPLFWDLFRKPGAIYWAQSLDGDKGGLDINYFSFDFNVIDWRNIIKKPEESAVFTATSACFVRCVN